MTPAPQQDRARPPVFVYGTLRPGRINHARLVRGRTVAEVPAVLPDAVLYEGPGYPYALPEPGSEVDGDLLHPGPGQYASLLSELDALEGYRPGAHDNLYERHLRTVRLRDGSTTEAWAYLAAEPLARRLRARGTPLPGGRWPAEDPDAAPARR